MKIDLLAKLQAITAERQTMQRRLEHLAHVEQALRLLITEEHAAATQQLVLFPGKVGNGRHAIGNTPNSRFLVEALGDGAFRPLDILSQIAVAKGMDFEGKNCKRVLHFALIGMQKNGYAEFADSNWRLTEKALQSLRGSITPSEDKKEGPVQGNNTPIVAGR